MTQHGLSFAQKRLLVLGGTSGIGLAVARQIVQAGGSAVLVGRRADKAAAAAAELARFGPTTAFAHALDDRAALRPDLSPIRAIPPMTTPHGAAT